MEVQENKQEIIEQNENKQGQLEEQGAQEVLVEQGHENEQQQKTFICSFPVVDEILGKKPEMERYNEEEKKLLMRMLKETRYDPE